MNQESKEKLYAFLQDQITHAAFRTHAYVYNDQGVKNLNRNAYIRIKKHIDNFLAGDTAVRWLVIPGLRGAGKTTVLAQLYYNLEIPDKRKLFLSIDQVVQTFGATLKDIVLMYEEALGGSFEKLEEPVFIFLDEAQYDRNWASFLKTVYDRSKKIFFVATGSAALMINTNPDIARRTISEKLFPMSFSEYIKIKKQKVEIKGLGWELRNALLLAENAKDSFEQIKNLGHKIKNYWLDIDRDEIKKYIRYGTLPFMVALKNEALVYDQIKKTLDRVISGDIPQIGKFSPELVVKIPMILYAIAESEQINLVKLSESLGISRPSLMALLDVLEQTETIIRIYPYGSHFSQARKPSKYLFSSPAFRSMYFNFIGSIQKKEIYEGKLLEDTVGLYLNRMLSRGDETFFTYDSAEGGADFITGVGGKRIVWEVGRGKKDFRQVEFTMGRVGAKYGIAIVEDEFHLNFKSTALKIPLYYFLLM